jgi:hypothetical protein
MRFTFPIVLFLLVSCELSTDQEMALNSSIQNIVKSRNEGDALMYLGLTHPSVVRYYKDQGDSIVKVRFQQVQRRGATRYYYEDDADGIFYWDRYFQKSIQKESDEIQVKIEVRGYFTDGEMKDSTFFLFALSPDKGQSWTFAEEQDYFADYFSAKRLFQSEQKK